MDFSYFYFGCLWPYFDFHGFSQCGSWGIRGFKLLSRCASFSFLPPLHLAPVARNLYSPVISAPLLHFSATPLGRADCRNLKCANWLPESCQKLCLKFIYLFFLPVSPCSSFFIPFLCLAMQNKVGKMKILQAREDFVKDK